MTRFFITIIFTILFSSCTTEERSNKSASISVFEEKVEFLNDIKNSFRITNIEGYKNISFTNYDVRFVETYPDKLKQIKSHLKIEDYIFFILQINEYEKCELENIDIDFNIRGFNYISKAELRKLGGNYNELWSNFRKKYGRKSLLVFSKPLFSKDSKLAIMEIQAIAESQSDSRKTLYAFKKKADKWEVLTAL